MVRALPELVHAQVVETNSVAVHVASWQEVNVGEVVVVGVLHGLGLSGVPHVRVVLGTLESRGQVGVVGQELLQKRQ